ncbi:hypothetical protein [Mycetocola zhadangensis]|uniref:DUF1795 domain-containing protein n=1 Tax=Mycetocola zhadangensis TaxID=1164595 RepID=A0A3L7JA34_9MICO|nr:hypothetical protein [Mycetocola zhadangensis]RLQ85372.1 hypothetical protein D9V28_00290 [Mycetocola zhadangensis]GGE82028.1 hypothetical protein GCM10011313_00570 [Mycetocola zhadangensis]
MATGSHITGVSLTLPENWFDVDLESADSSEWIAGLDIEYTDSADVDRVSSALDSIRSKFIADGVDVAAIMLPEPNGGFIAAAMVLRVLELDPDDNPETYLEFAESHRTLSSTEFAVSRFTSWRGTHPNGELIGFSHLALLTQEGQDHGELEERAVFAIFPPGAEEMVQITFRTARPDAFTDMAAETALIVDAVELELAP